MTRHEIRKQIATGWVNKSVAAMFLGFDLDAAKLDPLINAGVLTTWTRGTTPLVRFDDVLAATKQTANEFLDKHWPINRQRKPESVQTVNVLDTCAKRDDFRRLWDRLHRHVSMWIADADEDLSNGELRLAFQLMQLCRRASGFELILTAKQLQEATGMNREGLPKARRGLERRNILRTERSGTTAWVYSLCDPKTGLPIGNAPDSAFVTILADSWAD